MERLLSRRKDLLQGAGGNVRKKVVNPALNYCNALRAFAILSFQ